MNADMLQSTIRALAKMISGYLVAKGIGSDQGNTELIVGIALGVIAWLQGLWHHARRPSLPPGNGTKGILSLLSLLLVVSPLALMWGCSATLAPGGAYSQKWLYEADNTVANAYTVLDTFMAWELQNHNYLSSNAPGVVLIEEKIRTNAPNYFAAYFTFRKGYLDATTPGDANTSSNLLFFSLANIQSLVSIANTNTFVH